MRGSLTRACLRQTLTYFISQWRSGQAPARTTLAQQWGFMNTVMRCWQLQYAGTIQRVVRLLALWNA